MTATPCHARAARRNAHAATTDPTTMTAPAPAQGSSTAAAPGHRGGRTASRLSVKTGRWSPATSQATPAASSPATAAMSTMDR